MTDRDKWEIPGCPVAVWVSKCPEPTIRSKRLDVGSVVPLVVQWPMPDNWLARASERLAGLLYKVGIRCQKRWGQWRLASLETKAEVIQDNEAGLRLHVNPGVLTEGHRGTYAEIEGVDD